MPSKLRPLPISVINASLALNTIAMLYAKRFYIVEYATTEMAPEVLLEPGEGHGCHEPSESSLEESLLLLFSSALASFAFASSANSFSVFLFLGAFFGGRLLLVNFVSLVAFHWTFATAHRRLRMEIRIGLLMWGVLPYSFPLLAGRVELMAVTYQHSEKMVN